MSMRLVSLRARERPAEPNRRSPSAAARTARLSSIMYEASAWPKSSAVAAASLEVPCCRLVVTERDIDHAVRVQRGGALGCRLSWVVAALDELLGGAHVSPVEGRVGAQGLRSRGLFRPRSGKELIGSGGRRRDGVPAAHVESRRQQAEERVEPLCVRGGVVEGAVAGADAGGAITGPELSPLGDRQHLVQAVAIALALQRLAPPGAAPRARPRIDSRACRGHR